MSNVLFRIGMIIVVCSSFLTGQKTWGGTYLSVDVANDVFYLPIKTDQYFTSGISLEVGKQEVARSPFRQSGLATRTQYWRFTQNIFTPREIISQQLQANDRPFASYLVATRGRTYTDDDLGFHLGRSITIGVLGKYSGGGSMQNAFHEMVGFADPLPGWINEVKPDALFNYRLEIRQAFRPAGRLGLTTGLVTRLGTLHTDVATKLALKLVALKRSEHRLLTFELWGDARLVGYNATLTGGLINRDERYFGVIRPTRMVGQAGFEGVITYDGLELRGGIRHLSREFDGGLPHAWAWMGIRVMPGWQRLTDSRRNNRL
ncbi:MAG: lipid A-modifier LpxR family protein [Lewinella sp.]